MVEETIKPCPHCQADGTAHYIRMHERYVACARCGVRGPLSATEADAIAAWNRLSIAMEWARLLVAADEAHPGFAASVLAAGKAVRK